MAARMSVTTLDPKRRDAAAARLPGTRPVIGPWLTRDAAYSTQITEKARLLAERPDDVLAVTPGAEAACAEALEAVLAGLAQDPGYSREAGQCQTPDGRCVLLDGDPLRVIAALVQEDVCILERRGDEHVLRAALLCFPASWTLAEKIGHPLIRIHKPVAEYETGLAQRVQRLFDGVQEGRPIWRANLLRYRDPSLYQPRREGDTRPIAGAEGGWWRSERQTVLRLPNTQAVMFAIQTCVVPVDQGAD